MKLKFPAIYSYAEMGSRGAWTGNSLLPRSLCFYKSAQGKNVLVLISGRLLRAHLQNVVKVIHTSTAVRKHCHMFGRRPPERREDTGDWKTCGRGSPDHYSLKAFLI
ncbi:hypothetical protein ABH14_29875 [Brevibacillus brevis]|nr:hypothetical protein [Brevibacillus brevis]